jgi:hypothetical protein
MQCGVHVHVQHIDIQIRYIMNSKYAKEKDDEWSANLWHTHELRAMASDLGWDDVEHQSVRGVRRWILSGD